MTTPRAITIADLAKLVTRRSADYMTSKWTIRLEFPASEPVSIHSWQADLLAAIPSAPVPVVSDAAVKVVADELKAHYGPLGDPDEGTLCNCGAVVAPVGEYGVRAWREHVAGSVLDAVLPHLATVPSAPTCARCHLTQREHQPGYAASKCAYTLAAVSSATREDGLLTEPHDGHEASVTCPGCPHVPYATRDEVAGALEREFGCYLAHDPQDRDRFWGGAADALAARFTITPRADR